MSSQLHKLFLHEDDYEWFLDILARAPEEHKAHFLKQVYRKILGTDDPLEVAQKILGVNSPVELALKVIQTEEQLREFLERFEQRSYQTLNTSTQEPAASA